MFCKKCGNQIAEGAEFCQKCGVKVIETAEEQKTALSFISTSVPHEEKRSEEASFMTKKERLVMCLMGPFVMIPIITLFMLFDGDIDIGAPWIIANIMSIIVAVLIFLIVRNMVNKREGQK